MNLKHYLPLYCPLSKYQFDIERIRKEADSLSSYWTNVLMSNKELSFNHRLLIERIHQHYEQISLTVCNSSEPIISYKDIKHLKLSNDYTQKLSRYRKYKSKLSKRFDKSELDERNYNQITPLYKNTYIRSCVESLGGAPIRVRLVKLKPKQEVNWHIDYDPSYAVRLVLPIYTNPKVLNFFKRKNKIQKTHIPDNGVPWFLNTGFPHRVVNGGATDRILLLFSLIDCKVLIDYIKSI